MKSKFPSYFSTDEESRRKLWDECIFVFDTNVLTSLYKRSDEARNALLNIIRSLGDRVWIPHQVVYEFLNNRPTIAHEQSGMYGQAKKTLTDFIGDLESNTKHPFLSPELHARFVAISQDVIVALDEKANFYDEKIVNDDYREEVASLLDGKVGDAYSDERLKAVLKEGESRYANHIPPGYEDGSKHKGSTVFEHVRSRYGDLIIWLQVIDHAKAVNRPVILVTGDQKDDWWLRRGGKTISPRPELLDEFRVQAGTEFFMYSHGAFLSLANDYLDQRTSPAVIKEIEDAALEGEDELVEGDDVSVMQIEHMDLSQLMIHEKSLKSELNELSRRIEDAASRSGDINNPNFKRIFRRVMNARRAKKDQLLSQLRACHARMFELEDDFSDLV